MEANTLNKATAVATLLSKAINSKASSKTTTHILHRTSVLLVALTHSALLKPVASSTASKARLTVSTTPATHKVTPATTANKVKQVAMDKMLLHRIKHISNSSSTRVVNPSSNTLRPRLSLQTPTLPTTTLMRPL